MGNNQSACRQAYTDGKSKRNAFPLPYGHYRLDGLQRALNADRNYLERIQRAKFEAKNRVRPRSVHLPEDASGWLKTLPTSVSWRLGYDLSAAVQALAKDGVSSCDVRRIARVVDEQTPLLIDRLDIIHASLRQGGVKVEYSRMENGHSSLGDALDEIADLLAWVLSQLAVRGLAA